MDRRKKKMVVRDLSKEGREARGQVVWWGKTEIMVERERKKDAGRVEGLAQQRRPGVRLTGAKDSGFKGKETQSTEICKAHPMRSRGHPSGMEAGWRRSGGRKGKFFSRSGEGPLEEDLKGNDPWKKQKSEKKRNWELYQGWGGKQRR